MDELILPQVYALYDYWALWPPAHEATRLAWLNVKEKPRRGGGAENTGRHPLDDSGDVGAFFGMPGVTSEWHGPPPIKMADVIELADRARAKEKARQHG